MKTRESGMPEEDYWDSFFEPQRILVELGVTASCGDVVDFGCGYGTFAIPAARVVCGTVHALDIEAEMVAATAAKARAEGLSNVEAHRRDFVAEGTGLPDASVDFAMLFNILHAEQPEVLLREARRVLRRGGVLGVIHWNHDPKTPRGPSMDIRPRPDQCRQWCVDEGFQEDGRGIIALPPYHYGLCLLRP